uniref:Putative leucine-rich repeat-containing protein n=1 Tax=Schistosoma mansoni TaxID=6183 RepID=A0A3Q0KMA2_SCHMA
MFSKKQSNESRRLLEKKMYLARERPDDIFDLSSCELKMIPDGTFSLVKVLLKTKLYLQQNSLQKLDSGGKLTCLQNIVLLDISSNEFQQLPDSLYELKCLQVLNASKNLLSKLPSTITSLSQLLFLNVEDNRLTELPSEFGKLQQITKLYLKNNPLSSLPKQLCYLKELKELTLSCDHIQYPTSDICKLGLEAIMDYLSKEEGMKCCNVVANHTNVVSNYTSTNKNNTSNEMNERKMQSYSNNTSTPSSSSLTNYTQKRKEENLLALELERQSLESRWTEQEFSAKLNQNKQILVQLAEEEARVCAELSAIQDKRKQQRCALISNVTLAEQNAADIIKQILAINKSAKLIEKMEDVFNAHQFSSTDYTSLSQSKRNEILASMQEMLLVTDNAYAIHTMNLNSIKLHSLSNNQDFTSEYVQQILANKRADHTKLTFNLMLEESVQKEAFAQLQRQKDSQAVRLQKEICLIEEELCRLTLAERSRINQRTEVNQRVLDECRSELLQLLTQLLDEQQDRQKELRKRLEEIEQQKKDNQLDFWLVQYQRVLNSKPVELLDKPDSDVQIILSNAQSLEFLPNFQRHAITYSIMQTMTDSDLKEIGIHALGARREILRQIGLYKMKTNDEDKTLNTIESLPIPYVTPSAPEATLSSIVVSDEVVARMENECCVCQDAICSTIFLPCGHVCCCKKCSESVLDCPLCRSNIHNRIQLHF